MSDWFHEYGCTTVADGLTVGAYPLDDDDVAVLAALGIQRILNLVEDREYRPGERQRVETALLAAEIAEQRHSLVDYGSLPGQALEEAVQTVLAILEEGQHVYVHCRAGWQRSVAVAAGVIALRDGVDIDTALDRIRERRPTAEPLPHQRSDLRTWWSRRTAGSS